MDRASFSRALVASTSVPLVAIPLLHVSGGLGPWLLGPLLFLGAPHVLATVGLYADREIGPAIWRDRMRTTWGPAAAIPLCVTLFTWAPRSALLLLVAGFFVWQVQHYTRQNVGVMALWCIARGEAGPTPRERSIIELSSVAGAIGVVRAVDLLPAHGAVLQAAGVAAIVALCAGSIVAATGARRGALLVSSAFYLPLLLSAPGLLGAAFAYQAAHGAQYYVVVGQTIRADRRAVRAAVLSVLIGGSIAVTVLAPEAILAAPALYGLGKGLAVAHFLADARIWRMSDPTLGPLLRRRMALASVRTARSSAAAPSRSPLG